MGVAAKKRQASAHYLPGSPAKGAAQDMEVTPFFEHPADYVAVLRHLFFTYRAYPARLGPITVTVGTAKNLGQGVTFRRVDDRFYGFPLGQESAAEGTRFFWAWLFLRDRCF